MMMTFLAVLTWSIIVRLLECHNPVVEVSKGRCQPATTTIQIPSTGTTGSRRQPLCSTAAVAFAVSRPAWTDQVPTSWGPPCRRRRHCLRLLSHRRDRHHRTSFLLFNCIARSNNNNCNSSNNFITSINCNISVFSNNCDSCRPYSDTQAIIRVTKIIQPFVAMFPSTSSNNSSNQPLNRHHLARSFIIFHFPFFLIYKRENWRAACTQGQIEIIIIKKMTVLIVLDTGYARCNG